MKGSLNLKRINALKSSINEHYDNVMKILLSSKETTNRKNQIESTLRLCKESFLEALTNFLEEGSPEKTDAIKDALREVLSEEISTLNGHTRRLIHRRCIHQ